MHGMRTALIAVCVAACLSACNTTDALTPQVDIPNGGTTQSTPVTQSDAERMANTNVDSGRQSIDETATFNRQQSGFGAQNTLQAQADALRSGNNPVASEEQPTTSDQRTTAGETRTTALATPQQANGTLRFLPIIGAPVQAVTPLSRQLGAEARAHGLTIKSSADTSSEHILKGYFSAFSDGSQITVVYVWDVLDNAGGRLHRIQGQETVEGSAGEPWAAVPASAMQSIASKTINEYLRWRDSRAG